MEKRKSSIILVDLTNIYHKRANFQAIVEYIQQTEDVAYGYHVLIHPNDVNTSSLLYNLPDSFIPIYVPYTQAIRPSPDAASTEWSVYNSQRANPLRASMEGVLEASLRIQEQVFDNTNIHRLHAICENKLYAPLFKRLVQDISVVAYSPNPILRAAASSSVPWKDFEQQFFFPADYTRRKQEEMEET